MRIEHLGILACFLVLLGCQPQTSTTINIVDGNKLTVVHANQRTPAEILSQSGITLGPADRLVWNGAPLESDAALPGAFGTLQIWRAVDVSMNGKQLQTTAPTVGEALAQAGALLHAADRAAPAFDDAITGSLSVQYTPVRQLVIRVDGQDEQVLSAASTVGEALAEAGVPLLGLDVSKPAEAAPLPEDGQVSVVRVTEAIILAQKAIPFKNEVSDSPDVAVGQEQILQPGVQGLSVSRVRVRYEDGTEASRQTESETVVRQPQDRVTLHGTKITLNTATVNGVTFQYWLQLQMYATVYSPCNSGGGKCSSGTASGLRAGRGVVAVDPGLYASLNGQRLYIPGYGSAVIGDVGGGYIVEQNTGVSRYRWIDLGFDDNNITDMTGWVTVYFLAPAPASIPEVLK